MGAKKATTLTENQYETRDLVTLNHLSRKTLMTTKKLTENKSKKEDSTPMLMIKDAEEDLDMFDDCSYEYDLDYTTQY